MRSWLRGAWRPAVLFCIGVCVSAAGCHGGAASTPPDGRTLYHYCLQCHGAEGEGDAAIGAPPIAGLEAWYVESQLLKFQNGARGAHPDDEAGLRMRPMARTLGSADEVKAVATYVAALPRVPPTVSIQGDALKGAAHFQTCVACHQMKGEGNPALGAPAIAGMADWYLLKQLKSFKSGVRGTGPDDATGAQMRAISLSLDVQAMRDVVAHIATLPPPPAAAPAESPDATRRP